MRALYNRRFTTPPSLIVVQPMVRTFAVYSEAYRHLDDVFRFDELLPNCDFEKIPKNVPVVMIGPGNRHGIMAEDYPWYTQIRDINYLVKPAFYREYFEAVTGRRYTDSTTKWVEGCWPSVVWSSEHISREHYETGLLDRKNIIGFWPFSVEWAQWHGLSGIFCSDAILDMQSASLHGFLHLSETAMLDEQKRLATLLRKLIRPWPTHSLNLEALELLRDESTTIAIHNNMNIFVLEDGIIQESYLPHITRRFADQH